MKKGWKAWLDQELILLEKLRFEQHKTIKECAAILGRSFRSVESQVSKLSLWRPSKYIAYLPVLKNPHTLKGAAEILGIKVYAVKKAKQELKKIGIEVYTCPHTGIFKSNDPRRAIRWKKHAANNRSRSSKERG